MKAFMLVLTLLPGVASARPTQPLSAGVAHAKPLLLPSGHLDLSLLNSLALQGELPLAPGAQAIFTFDRRAGGIDSVAVDGQGGAALRVVDVSSHDEKLLNLAQMRRVTFTMGSAPAALLAHSHEGQTVRVQFVPEAVAAK